MRKAPDPPARFSGRHPIVVRIAEEARRKGLSQGTVAALAALSRPNVCNVLSGRRQPTLKTVTRLAAAVGLGLVLRPQGQHQLESDDGDARRGA